MGSEPLFLTVAHIVAPWGIKGEVKVRVLTDFPESLASQNQVYLKGRPLTIERSRRLFSPVKPQGKPEAKHTKGYIILKLATIDDREAAEQVRGSDLEIPLSQAHPLPEGEYYPLQLIGLEVQTEHGEPLGEVVDIWLRESNDIYVVQGQRGEILVPAIGDVVKSIDLQKGTMVIKVMNGLLE